MLFNSNEFILGFLPLAVLGFYLFGRFSRTGALAWLVLASIFFYAVWRPANLWIIGASIAVNFTVARLLLSMVGDAAKAGMRRIVLIFGIVFNILFLGYFKYANFAVHIFDDISGANFVLERIVLPLGISFITLQKIAFLVDVASGRIKTLTFREFLLFVMFFPPLIAGPITHYREVVPQFEKLDAKFNPQLFAAGITLFVFGLFKKVILADQISEVVAPLYAQAGAGADLPFFQAWLAALGFTAQIYFDFSAYSDMASGVALLFGIRLPTNFDSPLKTTNIIDFWAHWHMTLTRFLTAYLFNPISLALTRARVKAGKGVLRGRKSPLYAFLLMLAGPTLFTMTVAGIWHGAGYNFLIFGILHGLYIVINHAWRQYGPQPAPAGAPAALAGALMGFVLTLAGVAFANAWFRSDSVDAALIISKGMAGLNGLSLPGPVAAILHVPAAVDGAGAALGLVDFVKPYVLLGGLMAIAWFMPNTLQILAPYQPTLYPPNRPAKIGGFGPVITWRPNLIWTIIVASIAMMAMSRVLDKSEFLYWQF